MLTGQVKGKLWIVIWFSKEKVTVTLTSIGIGGVKNGGDYEKMEEEV
jgi:hypothetical protein